MGKRIEVGQAVPSFTLALADGREYVWRASMRTIKNISQASDVGAFQYLAGLQERYADNPIETVHELLYLGLYEQYPELTIDAIADMCPPSMELLLQFAEILADMFGAALPSVDPQNPTTPGATA